MSVRERANKTLKYFLLLLGFLIVISILVSSFTSAGDVYKMKTRIRIEGRIIERTFYVEARSIFEARENAKIAARNSLELNVQVIREEKMNGRTN